MSLVIRAAEPDEIAMLGEIERSAGTIFADHGMNDVAEGATMPPAFIVAFSRYGAALVADKDGTLAGFACAASFDVHAHLYEVSVARDFQGQGIGRSLVDAVCDWACEKGFKAITLSTFSDVPWNAPFYEKLGFRKLEQHAWTPAFHVLRAHEEDSGLDVARRCFMKKDLQP